MHAWGGGAEEERKNLKQPQCPLGAHEALSHDPEIVT